MFKSQFLDGVYGVTVVFLKLYLRKYIKKQTKSVKKPKLKLIGKNSFSFLLFIPSINVEFLLLNNKRKQCIIIQVGAMSCWPWIAYFVNLLSELLEKSSEVSVYIYIYMISFKYMPHFLMILFMNYYLLGDIALDNSYFMYK